MLPPKRSFDYLAKNSSYFKSLLERNTAHITTIISNNEYLLKKLGKSVYRQLIDIAEVTEGFYFTDGQYYRMKRGVVPACSNILTRILAEYHGLTVNELENLKRDDEV